MSKKKVLATLTPDEVEKFLEVVRKVGAVEQLQINLIKPMTEALKEQHELQNELELKHGFSGLWHINTNTMEVIEGHE